MDRETINGDSCFLTQKEQQPFYGQHKCQFVFAATPVKICWSKFYCSHAVADVSQYIRIMEKMLAFILLLLPTPSQYQKS